MFTRENISACAKFTRRSLLGSVIASTFLLSQPALADSPPPPPHDWDLKSQNGLYGAHGNLKDNKIIVGRIVGKDIEPMWEISRWMDPGGFFLSDDGQSLASFGWPEIRSGLEQDVLTIFYRGSAVHSWPLSTFYSDTEKLRKSASHMFWVSKEGWSEAHWIVTTIDGREFVFDEATGDLHK